MKRSEAEIIREYGPFAGVDRVNGVTFDGRHAWFASGDKLNALDPASGHTVRAVDVAAHAGTAFDGRHLYQLAGDSIQKIDPATGRVLATIRRPTTAVRGWPGLKDRSGSGSIGAGRSCGLIPRPERFCAPSSPSALSPASPGWTASCGTPPGKTT
jgi:hypothetical protein